MVINKLGRKAARKIAMRIAKGELKIANCNKCNIPLLGPTGGKAKDILCPPCKK